MKTTIFKDFTNIYPIQKTLRFELQPIGETEENIKKKGLISEDKIRADKYKRVKKVIDDFHREFIERTLENVSIDPADLQNFEAVYLQLKKKNKEEDIDNLRKLLIKTQEEIAKKIQDQVKKTQGWEYLFQKELIKKEIPAWLDMKEDVSEETKELVKYFKGWTTYFSGFNENRKNVYSPDKSTSIIYRIVYDNLPKFIDNIEKYNKLKEYNKLKDKHFDCGNIEKELQDEFQGKTLAEVFCLNFFNECLNQSGIERFNYIIGGKSKKDGSKIQGVNEYINLYSQSELAKERKTIKSCKMTRLFKQILSDVEKRSFVFEKFGEDAELVKEIKNFLDIVYYQPFDEHSENKEPLLQRIKTLIQNFGVHDLAGIHIKNDQAITNISTAIYGNWYVIRDALIYAKEKKFPSKTTSQTIIEQREKWIKNTPYFSIAVLEKALNAYFDDLEKEDNELLLLKTEGNDVAESRNPICAYFEQLEINKKNEKKNVFKIEDSINKLQVILDTHYPPKSKKLVNDKESIEIIKKALDDIMDIFHFVKPLYVDINNKNDDKKIDALQVSAEFYALLCILWV